MFPVRDYAVRRQGSDLLHILDKNAESPAAKQIVDLVASTFTAIDRKILQSILIGFVDDPTEPQRFVECYQIRLSYSDQRMSIGSVSITLRQVTCLT